ncbi:MAG: 4Fe-4S double cluster binding domain-containing protein [Thermodesulfobacteriota bacterium]
MNQTRLKKVQKQLAATAGGMGARFFGTADLTGVGETIAAQGGDYLSAYPRALSMGIVLADGIVDQLPRHKEPAVARTYDYLYFTVNRALDRIALQISILLNRNGFQTHLVPASDKVDDIKMQGLFSHKLAARLAGLGWIGPSCLLITPDAGPRVRWVTVLTDALLAPGEPMESRCGDCRKCVEACPPKAFTGRYFDPREHRDARFMVKRCDDYRRHLQSKVTGTRTCGMCVQACPFGQGTV